MKKTLDILVDVSGSMKEMGKIHLQRNLCRYAAQLHLLDRKTYTDFNIRLFQWTQSIAKIVLLVDGDIPALTAEGSASLSVVSEFVLKNVNKTRRWACIILTDGHFPTSDIANFQQQLQPFPELIIRTVAVGADADLLKLKKISTNSSVYLPENIASAIDSTIFGSDEPPVAPQTTTQILLTPSTKAEVKSEEDWDG